MNVPHRNKGVGLAASGLGLQILGAITNIFLLSTLMAVAGTALLMLGLAWVARSKGRTPLWGLLGVFSILGPVILYVLPDTAGPGRLSR